MSKTAQEYVQTHRDEILQDLEAFLRIPSISAVPAHKAEVQRAAGWLVSRMKAIGLERTAVIPTPDHPVVYGEWLGAGPHAPTVLFYGHYDVQPIDPEEEWLSPPFEPTLRQGNLYARGVSDDKGQFYTHLAAVEAFFRADGAPPLNVKFLIEGEEEIGSRNLGSFVQQNAPMLACDAAVISDTSLHDEHTPSLVYGVRGMVYMEVTLEGPKSDLHSGQYGGVVHNPLQVAVDILSALHDQDGRVAIPGFYDKVRPLSEEEKASLARIPFNQRRFLRDEVGAPALWEGEKGYSVLERIGARPTLEIHGIRGGYTGEGQKTVIPAKVTFKVSMRLVPYQDPHEIARLFEQQIYALAPNTVNVQVRTLAQAHPALIDRNSPAMQIAARAYRHGFGAEPVFSLAGGSIPVVTMFDQILKVPVILMGFGLPDDNLHAPNEKLRLENFYRGIDTSIHFMSQLAARGK